MNKKIRKIRAFLFWLIPVALVQILAGLITSESIGRWYNSLKKAPWNPPAWVFGPVWSLLYMMMVVAVWIISQSKSIKNKKNKAYILFCFQLFFNGLWSFLFFGLQNPGWALIDLVVLTILIALTFLSFYRINKKAGFLLLPYLLWTIYALSLNIAIWWLNLL